ncbi:MAG TPA: hypothetical protein PLB41_03945 [Rubrivivax sp.]|nr:hypothetical protein [Rubrivivax sp.]HPO21019.1 hypothetical protein [Rubrivivax sp.]
MGAAGSPRGEAFAHAAQHLPRRQGAAASGCSRGREVGRGFGREFGRGFGRDFGGKRDG